MMVELRDKIVRYVSKNALLTDWKSVREHYGKYSYLAFMCLVANDICPGCDVRNIESILVNNFLEAREIVHFILMTEEATEFLDEVMECISHKRVDDINEIYQEFISRDFILKKNEVSFSDGKNNRDILGSYYTQEDFAYEITKKTLVDYLGDNYKENIKVADYSCGGGAFLVSACKVCRENNISIRVYGYDVDPIAVLITRFRLYKEVGIRPEESLIFLGNPLLRKDLKSDKLSVFKCAMAGRFYNYHMGIVSENEMDVTVGNPPWEKIRFEEKKFLSHYAQGANIGTKMERGLFLKASSPINREYYEECINDYETAKSMIKRDVFFEGSRHGELNTYALFAELCLKSLNSAGVSGIIIKSSLVKMPIYRDFFGKINKNKNLYELYMFVNRRKIFNIDSREEFSVMFLKTKYDGKLGLALNLECYEKFHMKEKIYISHDLLNDLNPDTGMIPNIASNEELEFLILMYKNHNVFSTVYPECRFGRLVHLTNHSASIEKNDKEGYLPIYEGKFIEIYTAKFASFKGVSESEKYKNKAMAKPIENVDGKEYPQSRFYIREKEWKNLSKNFRDEYVVAWRSLTSATNRRTMLSTILPLIPTCQSIQILQLPKDKMLHVLALFNSIIFDYLVRLKMAGLDLTQTIIKQIPVPEEENYNKLIEFMGKKASIEVHINTRIKKLYKSDSRMNELFEGVETYCLGNEKIRKDLIAELDSLVAMLYSIDRKKMKQIATSFDKYYNEEEIERLF